jgi:hypothetical protein
MIKLEPTTHCLRLLQREGIESKLFKISRKRSNIGALGHTSYFNTLNGIPLANART